MVAILQKKQKVDNPVRNIIGKMYEICGCPNADRLSKLFLGAYDRALMNGSVYDDTEEDIANPGNRIAPMHPGNFSPIHKEKAETIFARLVICEFASYLRKKKIDYVTMQSVKNKYDAVAKIADSDLDKILSYDYAVMGFWGP